MFVRKKRNKSGSVSVQIVDKSNGRYRVVETIGSSQDQEKVDFLIRKAQHVIRTCGGRQSELFSFRTPEETAVRCFLGGLSNEQIRVIGPELVFGTLFDRLGFGAIPEPLFRHMV